MISIGGLRPSGRRLGGGSAGAEQLEAQGQFSEAVQAALAASSRPIGPC